MSEFTEIRNPIDVQALSAYLANVPASAIRGLDVPPFFGPFDIKQFTFGQSNPTYLVVDGSGSKYVLRRKPMPNSKLVSKSAHAIEREFFLLKGIENCNQRADPGKKVPVPKVYFLCEDESVLGVVFYVMEYVQGRSFKEPDMREVPAARQSEYWDSIMKTISAIHSVDCSELVKQLPAKHFPQFQPDQLERANKNGATYFQRQIRTLGAVEKSQSKTVDSIPGFSRLTQWVLDHSPRDPDHMTLVHGDCKIDNFLFHGEKPEVAAVLDWELCTMGHPIFDLANFLQPYTFPKSLNKAILQTASIGIEDPTSAQHVQTVLSLYEKFLGHKWRENDPRNNPHDLWKLGTVFGLLRLCVISQGVAMRVKRGTASSASAKAVAELYKTLSELALSFIEEDYKL
ncbi:hypothetical protein METBIDRAFT_46240 [Metschnikowia bicuspidata var. bicuspidata NRRL YB-4993]|uniref:Aminoglycoside phosphotransferase domain-containing protein n=1 Tax=Metschnikowia bicuspidata var. bicuspidata NRRL YB-4993 TaxID=869754 RepID=A0A1A0H6F9_9ASCO|nr:hypothetical protein METBIDRAFT_46240 [Metschnikowia bicuspidata var. bicuspidata NRRL YB-4993]OBA19492.1 hypothetical protein METBIDRAFT_46240 [Metschnikowia bicuspidata var. bicuspidata NRRL YB-4993]